MMTIGAVPGRRGRNSWQSGPCASLNANEASSPRKAASGHGASSMAPKWLRNRPGSAASTPIERVVALALVSPAPPLPTLAKWTTNARYSNMRSAKSSLGGPLRITSEGSPKKSLGVEPSHVAHNERPQMGLAAIRTFVHAIIDSLGDRSQPPRGVWLLVVFGNGAPSIAFATPRRYQMPWHRITDSTTPELVRRKATKQAYLGRMRMVGKGFGSPGVRLTLPQTSPPSPRTRGATSAEAVMAKESHIAQRLARPLDDGNYERIPRSKYLHQSRWSQKSWSGPPTKLGC